MKHDHPLCEAELPHGYQGCSCECHAMEPELPDYQVSVANIFQAESPEDAVIQMAEWLLENSQQAGYRVINDETGESLFIDAEDVY